MIIGLLILRRGSEWIAELQISERELSKDLPFAQRFLFIQIVSLFLLIASLGFEDDRFFKMMLMVWAIAPVLQVLPFIFRMHGIRNGGLAATLKGFVPHLGSSWAIAISVYVFRVLIVLLAGRDTGGMLFSAFAIGGMLNSVYTYALGPSLMLNGSEKESVPKNMWITVLTLAVMGAGYVEDYGIERFYRDVRLFRIYEGTSPGGRETILPPEHRPRSQWLPARR